MFATTGPLVLVVSGWGAVGRAAATAAGRSSLRTPVGASFPETVQDSSQALLLPSGTPDGTGRRPPGPGGPGRQAPRVPGRRARLGTLASPCSPSNVSATSP